MKKNVLRRAFATIAVMLAVTAVMSSCKSNWNTGMSGNIEYTQNELKARSFNKISVSLPCDVYYTQNDGDACNVKVDYSGIDDPELVAELKEKVKVAYRNGGVEIGCKNKITVPSSCNAEGKRLKIYITSPDIVKITQEGVGSFHAKDINSDRLTIDNEGVGSVYITKILANQLDVDNEGVGSVNIDEATGDKMTIDNEGVGSVKVKTVAMGNLGVDNEGVGSVALDFFKGGNLKVVNEGVGKVTAHVECKSVNATLDGVGGIHLSGSTQTYTRNKDGVGSISDRDLKVGK